MDRPRADYLFAVTGHAGAGKSTALAHLALRTNGVIAYLGRNVTDEVARLGLPPTSASETIARKLLRKADPAALAVRELPKVEEILSRGVPALVDAIYVISELSVLRAKLAGCACNLIHIDTSFRTRCERVATREGKSLTARELQERDEYELQELGISDAFAAADWIVSNEGSQEDLVRQLDEVLKHVIPATLIARDRE